MLIRLLPDQIMRYWDEIRDCIAVSIPPTSASEYETFLNLQAEFLSGSADVWIYADVNGIHGIMTTKIITEDPSETKNLLIYSITSVDDVPPSAFTDAIDKLRKYAGSCGCRRIIAYSDNPKIVRLAQRLGADTSWTMMYFDI